MTDLRKNLLFFWAVATLLLPLASDSNAAHPALIRASQLLREEQAAEIQALDGIEKSFEQTALQRLGLTRFYKTGDRWVVALAVRSLADSRRSPLTRLPHGNYSSAILYDFQVTATGQYRDTAGAERTWARIEIAPRKSRFTETLRETGAPRVLRLVINDHYRGIAKTYDDRATYRLDTRRNLSAGVERFPIDVPNVSRALGQLVSAFPVLPESLAPLASRLTNLARNHATLSFEYRDWNARSLQVLWAEGDLWPTYTQTDSAIAVLVEQQRSSR